MKFLPKIIAFAYLGCILYVAYNHFNVDPSVIASEPYWEGENPFISRAWSFCYVLFLCSIPALIFFFVKNIGLPLGVRIWKNPMKEIRNGFGMNKLQITTLILSTALTTLVVAGCFWNLETLKSEGAPPDFIEAKHEELGYLVAMMLVPSSFAFYLAGFAGKKYINDH